MTKKYHGKNTLASIKPLSPDELLLKIQVAPQDINFVLKIIESHSHLVIPVQIDPAQGLLGLHTTKDQAALLNTILANIPRPIKIC